MTTLTDEEIEWAYGADWQILDISVSPERWNERHGDLFKIWAADEIEATEEKIINAFRDRKIE